MKYHMDTLVARNSHELPALWAEVYPRRILTPSGYFNPMYYSCLMYSIKYQQMAMRLQGIEGYKDFVTSCMATTTHFLMKLRVPTYFVASDFAEALAETKIEASLSLLDFHWPDNAMLFVFPDKFIKEYTGGYDCPFLSFAGIMPIRPDKPNPYLDSSDGQFYEYAKRPDFKGSMVTHYQVFKDRYTDTAWDYVGQYAMDRPVTLIEESLGREFQMTESEKKKLESGVLKDVGIQDPKVEHALHASMMSLGLKVLLSMEANPQFIERQSRPFRVAKMKHGKMLDETWQPQMVGLKYRHPVKPWQGGTHASPKFHRRQGFLRNQAHGPGRTLRKVVQIFPVWVYPRNPKGD